MAGKTHPDTLRGLELIAQGTPVREAARLTNTDPRTLTRAKAKAGMPAGKPGRPARQAADPAA